MQNAVFMPIKEAWFCHSERGIFIKAVKAVLFDEDIPYRRYDKNPDIK